MAKGPLRRAEVLRGQEHLSYCKIVQISPI
jgi:hypothetical protein